MMSRAGNFPDFPAKNRRKIRQGKNTKIENKEQGKMKIALKRHVFAAHFSPAGRRCRRAVNLNGLREEIA